MKLTNSYVFVPQKNTKVKDNKNNNNNKLVIVESMPRRFEKYFNIDLEQILLGEVEQNPKKFSKEILNRYNQIISGTFFYTVDDIQMKIWYKFTKADDIYYLDISLNDHKSNIIRCFEKFNETFLTANEFTSAYITIISYDCVSEYYCNKINPLLNKFERKLRKLLFLIFTSQYKELYFEATAPKKMVDDTKKIIKKENNTYRIQNYFYSLDIGTLRSYLFDKNWTDIEEKKKEEILNRDLSKINPKKLKKMIEDIEPKSNWDRFFQNKGFAKDIDITMKTINDLRNIVAHNKIMTKNDYDVLYILLEENLKVIGKAIDITEQVDFKIINRNKRIKMLENFRNILLQSFNNIQTSIYSSNIEKTLNMLKETLNNQKTKYDKIGEEINKLIIDDEK